jgi:hypothetical protein
MAPSTARQAAPATPRPVADATGTPDPDQHKGAVEGDRPNDAQNANPHGKGVDKQGLPNDPVATAEDRIGANNDDSQG